MFLIFDHYETNNIYIVFVTQNWTQFLVDGLCIDTTKIDQTNVLNLIDFSTKIISYLTMFPSSVISKT